MLKGEQEARICEKSRLRMSKCCPIGQQGVASEVPCLEALSPGIQ